MPLNKIVPVLQTHLDSLTNQGTRKGFEKVIVGVKRSEGLKGPRYFIEGRGEQEFIKMNANSYLGMSLRHEIIESEEAAAREFGAGPGAVRFISGTYKVHTNLEERLAAFHGREAAMIFSSAYATVMGTLSSLITSDTVVISDELNHNCIINAVRLSRPAAKEVYKHCNTQDFEVRLKENIGKGKRALIITDGIFSMRGDHAPLDKLCEIIARYHDKFTEGIILVVDDSHGIGAFGKTGRGTEEYTNADGVDILIATLGKALGVNGGYITSSKTIIQYLRETAPFYIYSNPITPGEAKAALTALEILDSEQGHRLLEKLRSLTARFEKGLIDNGYEVIRGEHPVVPLMVRDTQKTGDIVRFIFERGVLATGLSYPVVPRGDEEIRFQISCDHTEHDIDFVIDLLKQYREMH